MAAIEGRQKKICQQYGVAYCPSAVTLKVGIALNVRDGLVPLNVEHLSDWCPTVQKYLGLPPGWRFLIAPAYEDVWYAPSLLVCDS